jgi:hypothetical protein
VNKGPLQSIELHSRVACYPFGRDLIGVVCRRSELAAEIADSVAAGPEPEKQIAAWETLLVHAALLQIFDGFRNYFSKTVNS